MEILKARVLRALTPLRASSQYSLLISGSGKSGEEGEGADDEAYQAGHTGLRLDQIIEWLGNDGVVALDEEHRAKTMKQTKDPKTGEIFISIKKGVCHPCPE